MLGLVQILMCLCEPYFIIVALKFLLGYSLQKRTQKERIKNFL